MSTTKIPPSKIASRFRKLADRFEAVGNGQLPVRVSRLVIDAGWTLVAAFDQGLLDGIVDKREDYALLKEAQGDAAFAELLKDPGEEGLDRIVRNQFCCAAAELMRKHSVLTSEVPIWTTSVRIVDPDDPDAPPSRHVTKHTKHVTEISGANVDQEAAIAYADVCHELADEIDSSETAMKSLGDDDPEGKQVDPANDIPSGKAKTTSGAWLADAMLRVRDNPEMSDSKIAGLVGVHKSTLSKSDQYQVAARIARQPDRKISKGFTTRNPETGKREGIEAYAD